jgi:hypothetical protein
MASHRPLAFNVVSQKVRALMAAFNAIAWMAANPTAAHPSIFVI